MNRLVVPTPLFRQLLAGLSGRSHPLAVMPVGMQMLQYLMGERIRASLWAHSQFEETGRLTVAYPSFPSSGTSPCPLCAKSGLGDGGLGWR